MDNSFLYISESVLSNVLKASFKNPEEIEYLTGVIADGLKPLMGIHLPLAQVRNPLHQLLSQRKQRSDTTSIFAMMNHLQRKRELKKKRKSLHYLDA